MSDRNDGAEACGLCGAPAFAAHADGEVHAGYGSRHDTTSFVEIPPAGGGSPFPAGGCPVCDGCIDRLLAEGRLVAWAAAVGPRPAGLDAATLEAVFLLGARRARKRVERARAGRGGFEAALRTLSGAIDLPEASGRVAISLAPEPRREADPYAAGAATALALAACLRPFGEADVAPLAREWAGRVVRDRGSVADALAAIGAMAREMGEGEGGA